MTQELKILLGVGISTIVILIGAVVFLSGNSTPKSSTTNADPKMLIKDDSNKMGTDSAKIKLVEFGDYQCPSCGQAHPIIKAIMAAYEGKIEFVFRNFPLSIHPNAQPAAQAAEAAGAQGKYWQMHDMIYENQGDWSNESNPNEKFIGYAKSLGLDMGKFKSDIESQKFQSKISADISDGTTLGVNATPTFYLNNEQIVGAQSFNDLKTKIDSLLK